MTELVLIRHGQLPADCAGKLIGRSDVPLSEEGREQCRRLAPLFDSFEVEKVYASPLSRTMESARLVVRDTREIFPDSRLQEFDFGAFGNREFAEANRTGTFPPKSGICSPRNSHGLKANPPSTSADESTRFSTFSPDSRKSGSP